MYGSVAGSRGTAARAGAPRRRPLAAALLSAAVLGFVAFRHASRSTDTAVLAEDAAGEGDFELAGGGPLSYSYEDPNGMNHKGGWQRFEIPMKAFLQFPAVIEWLKDQEDIDDPHTADYGKLLNYLPSRFTIDYNPNAVDGSLGIQARKGYVAFNLFYGYTASWLVIVGIRGELMQVAPVRATNAEGYPHICALKNYNEDTLLLVSSENYTAAGHAWKWHWQTNEFERIGGDSNLYGAHDIQWAADGDAFWNPNSAWHVSGCNCNNNVTKYDATTGDVLDYVLTDLPNCDADVNHAQLLEGDTEVLFSFHNYDAISKFSADGEMLYIVGGSRGTWEIRDFDGTIWPAGTTVWKNQHNAEYMGENEVFMFDDEGLGNQSRLLIVQLDEDRQKATLAWEYRLGSLAQVYGDCDPLPSGNVIGSYWRQYYGNKNEDDQAQSGIIEVVRGSSEMAWQLLVYGPECKKEKCQVSYNYPESPSWVMYSVERFYNVPLMPDPNRAQQAPACVDDELSFTVYNTFKQSSGVKGSFELIEVDSGKVAAEGNFDFEAHWRPTYVTSGVDLSGAEKNNVQLAVSNNRGKTLRYNFQCLYTSGRGRDSSTLLNSTVNGTVNTSTIDSTGISTGGPPSNATNSTSEP